ncbi:MAG: precorrin-6y C5,15-methyltransferase (decarboxylating) subunit CbiE [Rhizobiales bacterium]|nr:precorrin-6y C5,15-methyltransferase (decarboxylating) subunit CbiE [Hyphomicrobiales bacterium]
MTKWLSIIGMGEDGYDGLSARARLLVDQAEVIVGAERLLSLTPQTGATREVWPQPFSAVVTQIRRLRGRKTALLATGDPCNYGVARKVLEFIPATEVEIVPHISAFSLAAARLCWSLPDCDTLTLHGRPAAQIEAFIQPGARLIALTENAATIAEVARRLVARRFGQSRITVLENMGGAREKQSSFRAADYRDASYSDLNTIGIECIPDAGAALLPRVPGLPDNAYVHDGQLTKREVRAATLAALGPTPDALLWDVGAGCGSIAIEWMRAARGARAIAIERDESRLAMLAENADRLGTPRINIVNGEAPAALAGLEEPDAVFIGGGVGDPGVFETSWEALKSGGRMVANVVTLEGELHVIDLQDKHGGDLVRIDVSVLSKVGDLRALKPRMSVLQWRAIKP